MKKIKFNFTNTLVLLFLLTTTFTSGCIIPNGVRGDGNVVKEERNVKEFNEIQVSGAYMVYLTQGSKEELIIEADENLMDLITTKVVDGKLKIYNKKDIRSSKKMNIYLTFVEIDELSVSGAVDIEGTNKFTLNELSLNVSGAAEIFLDIELKELDAELSGASEFEIRGFAKEVVIEISGASELDASDFKVEEMQIEISGAADAKVFATESLEINASGASNIKYRGNPSINQRASGASSIRKF